MNTDFSDTAAGPTGDDREQRAIDEAIEACGRIGIRLPRDLVARMIEERAMAAARPLVAEVLARVLARLRTREVRPSAVALMRALGTTSPASHIMAARAFLVTPKYLGQLHEDLAKIQKKAGPSW